MTTYSFKLELTADELPEDTLRAIADGVWEAGGGHGVRRMSVRADPPETLESELAAAKQVRLEGNGDG